MGMNFPTMNEVSTQESSHELSRFMSKVYSWMTLGVLITAFVSYFVASNPEWAIGLVRNRAIFYGLLFAQVGLVFFFSAAVNRLGAGVATMIYLLYSMLVGVTMSVIFLVFTRDSIMHVFGLTAFSFAGLSGFGYVTKRDLGPVGSFCIMGLFGMVGFALISLFFPSMMTDTASKVYGVVGIIVFSGLTAYDTQKIKALYWSGGQEAQKAISAALTLYLDFINLFMSLLRVLGRRR